MCVFLPLAGKRILFLPHIHTTWGGSFSAALYNDARLLTQHYLCKLYPSDGVTKRVQSWRPQPDAHYIGDDEDEGAGYARLGRQANFERELSRVVVHATTVH